MQWLTALKLGALGLIAILALALRAGSWSHFAPFITQRPGSDPLPVALAAGLVGAFFAFGGWWESPNWRGKRVIRRARLPRALAIGVRDHHGGYIMTSAVFLYLVSLERVTSGETFAAQAGEACSALQAAACSRALSSWRCSVACWGSSWRCRASITPWRATVCSQAVAAVHPRFGTRLAPSRSRRRSPPLYVALGTFNQIIGYFVFVTVLFVGLTVAGLFPHPRRAPAASYRTWGYPVTPVVFLVLVAVVLFLVAARNPLQAASVSALSPLGCQSTIYFFVDGLARTPNP